MREAGEIPHPAHPAQPQQFWWLAISEVCPPGEGTIFELGEISEELEWNNKSTEVNIIAGRRLVNVSKCTTYFIPTTLVILQALGERVGRHEKPVPVHANDSHMLDRAIRTLQAITPLRGSDHRAVGAHHEYNALSDALSGVMNLLVTERHRNLHGHGIPS